MHANDNLPALLPRLPGETVAAWLARRIAADPRRPAAAHGLATGEFVQPEASGKVRRSPIRAEHFEGRIDLPSMMVFDAVERIYANANARFTAPLEWPRDELVGAEISAHYALELQHVQDDAAHLWPAVEAAILNRTMTEIGAEFGAAHSFAAAIGREKLVDALKFIARGMAARRAAEAANDWRAGLAA